MLRSYGSEIDWSSSTDTFSKIATTKETMDTTLCMQTRMNEDALSQTGTIEYIPLGIGDQLSMNESWLWHELYHFQ